MEINSNSRNKPTADWISNKNAIASNNVSFVSNVVWIVPLAVLKTPRLLYVEPAIFQTFCLLFYSSFLSAVYCQHDDLWPAGQPITSVVFHETRALYLRDPGRRIWSAVFHCIPEQKAHTFAIFTLSLHTQVVCTCCLWHVDIAVQCCQFSVFS